MTESPFPAVDAAGLAKTYDDLVALEPLDLLVEAGQSVALIGHNDEVSRVPVTILDSHHLTHLLVQHECFIQRSR